MGSRLGLARVRAGTRVGARLGTVTTIQTAYHSLELVVDHDAITHHLLVVLDTLDRVGKRLTVLLAGNLDSVGLLVAFAEATLVCLASGRGGGRGMKFTVTMGFNDHIRTLVGHAYLTCVEKLFFFIEFYISFPIMGR